MYEHTCKKDKKYIISTNSDCVVTDVETGIVLAVVLAKTQKVVQAISNKFTTSVECSIRPFVEATVDIDIIGGGEDDLPAGYKRIEYLESSGTQYISTRLDVDASYGASVEWALTKINNYSSVLNASNLGASGEVINSGSFMVPYWNGVISPFYASFMSNDEHVYTLNAQAEIGVRYVSLLNFRNSREVKLNDSSLGIIPADVQSFICKNPVLFGSSRNGTPIAGGRLTGKIFRAQISRGAILEMYFVPVLDDTGTPCMYDKVSRKCFYNSGSGDFVYPTDEYAIQTLDLDYIVYGKMTETGIRRLYKVPAGETMTRDDYAAANGYKEIIEPPMPREGYWTSQWKETDTQLILEWVETEAPAEEV